MKINPNCIHAVLSAYEESLHSGKNVVLCEKTRSLYSEDSFTVQELKIHEQYLCDHGYISERLTGRGMDFLALIENNEDAWYAFCEDDLINQHFNIRIAHYVLEQLASENYIRAIKDHYDEIESSIIVHELFRKRKNNPE